MDLNYLREKIKQITDDSKSEEVKLLGRLIAIKSEFDDANINNLMTVLNEHRRMIDELNRKFNDLENNNIKHSETEANLQSQISFERARRLQLHPNNGDDKGEDGDES